MDIETLRMRLNELEEVCGINNEGGGCEDFDCSDCQINDLRDCVKRMIPKDIIKTVTEFETVVYTCPTCGAEWSFDTNFCPECGQAVEVENVSML